MNFIKNMEHMVLYKKQLEYALEKSSELSELKYQLDILNSFDPINYRENYVKFQVFSIISYYSGFKISQIDEEKNLQFELGLNLTEKGLMTRKFNLLIKEFNGQKFITIDEGKKFEFVKDCIKAVISNLPK